MTAMLSAMINLNASLGHALPAAAWSGTFLPAAGSDEARGVDQVFSLLLLISTILLVVVLGAIVLFAARYRRRESCEMAPRSPASCHRYLRVWIAISVLFVVAVFIIGEKSYSELNTSPRYAYEVSVAAADSKWAFEHPNGKIQDDGQLFVPANRPVRFVMNTADLSYAMMMPDFRLHQDLVPGHESSLWFQAVPGQYILQGGEYCGPKFDAMHASMTVYPEEEFQASLDTIAFWLDRYSNDDLYKAGYRLYANCKSCHTLNGERLVGPSFQTTHQLWGEGQSLADGRTVVVDEDYIRKSVLTPAADIVAGFKNEMTSFAGQFREREIVALIQFIKRLNEVVDAEGNAIVTEEDSQ
jgi:cytochrome c oxidase subunit II